MREIMFRGQAANRIEGRAYRTNYKNGDWVYGLLTDVENYAGFSEMTNTNGVSGIEVGKNTVGQYTGLTDMNGVKIFEGDIIEWDEKEWGCEHRELVEWNYSLFSLRKNDWKEFCKVIGNIHDNPELLEVSK